MDGRTKGYVLALASGVFIAASTILRKEGVPQNVELSLSQISALASDPRFPVLLAGFALVICSDVLIVNAFRFGRSNVLFALMGGAETIALVSMSYFALKEPISPYALLGAALIISGIAMMGRLSVRNVWRKSEQGKEQGRQ